MTSPRIQYRLNSTPTLRFEPSPDRLPDGDVELTIFISGDSEFTGTWPAVLTTPVVQTVLLTADVEKQDRVASVTSVADLSIGDRISVVDRYGRIFAATVAGLDPALDQILMDNSPSWDIEMGTTGHVDTLWGEYLFTSDQTTARRRALRAVFEYEIDGKPQREVQYIDIVMEPFDVEISSRYMSSIWPEFASYEPDDWRSIADEVIQNELYNELLGEGLEPDLIRDTRPLQPWAGILIILALSMTDLMAKQSPAIMEMRDQWRTEAQRVKSRVLASRRTWYDSGDRLTGDNTASFVDGGEWYSGSGGVYSTTSVPSRAPVPIQNDPLS